MDSQSSRFAKILSRLAPEDFVGRSAETEKIRRHAQRESGELLILGAPQTGASELLRQIYDSLFYERGEVVPFYFAVGRADKTVEECAKRFLREFLTQFAAFGAGDATLLNFAPGISEIARRSAQLSGADWIKSLIDVYERERDSGDMHAFVKICLSAPQRAAATGSRIFVMIDDLHNAEDLTSETNLIEQFKEIYSRFNAPFVFAGRRRFLHAKMRTGNAIPANAETLRIGQLSLSDAERLTEKLAARYAIKMTDETRDLIVRQLDSNALVIESLFAAARERQIDLNDFRAFQQIYANEIFGGGIGKFYDGQFDEIALDFNVQAKIVELLYEAQTSEGKKISDEDARSRLEISDREFYRVARSLHTREMANWSSGAIEAAVDNLVLKDYIEARRRLENETAPRALIFGEQLTKFLSRSAQLMKRNYRRAAALDLRRLMETFDCQSVPSVLLDYAKFAEHKGAPDDEILEKINAETGRIVLPKIVFAAQCQSFYAPLARIADAERCTATLGYEPADYRPENETVWIAAEIDSKLEASRETAEFWCDRLEMVALACRFAKYRLWLVAPEGFTVDALKVLNERNAYSSSRAQFKLLSEYLNVEITNQPKTDANEYEIIVPMSDDAEMIAARAVEEIARRHGFQPKAIAQIKTALVEACINAGEHSLSLDRRIHQKITVEKDKITVAVSNRGVKISPAAISEMTPPVESENGRRGWGIKLMRTLMDEVKFEPTDDGTRILLIKYLEGEK